MDFSNSHQIFCGSIAVLGFSSEKSIKSTSCRRRRFFEAVSLEAHRIEFFRVRLEWSALLWVTAWPSNSSRDSSGAVQLAHLGIFVGKNCLERDSSENEENKYMRQEE